MFPDFKLKQDPAFFVVNFDVQTAKELLVLAGSSEEQKMWVNRLSKKVAKKGYTHSNDKGTPRYYLKSGIFANMG